MARGRRVEAMGLEVEEEEEMRLDGLIHDVCEVPGRESIWFTHTTYDTVLSPLSVLL